jgi:hypothetical protein
VEKFDGITEFSELTEFFRRGKAAELARRDGIPGFFPDSFMSS